MKNQIAEQASLALAESLIEEGWRWQAATERARYGSPKAGRRAEKAKTAFTVARDTLFNLWREVAPEEEGKFVVMCLLPDRGTFPSEHVTCWAGGGVYRRDQVGYTPYPGYEGPFSLEEVVAAKAAIEEKFPVSEVYQQTGWYCPRILRLGLKEDNGTWQLFSPTLWEISHRAACEAHRRWEEENWREREMV
jgi:hypothetical protein